jgi:hypothetical protein
MHPKTGKERTMAASGQDIANGLDVSPDDEWVDAAQDREWCKICFHSLPTEMDIAGGDGVQDTLVEECRRCGGLRINGGCHEPEVDDDLSELPF